MDNLIDQRTVAIIRKNSNGVLELTKLNQKIFGMQ